MTDNLKPLWNPCNGQLRIAGFMSGSGSNIRKIIEYEKQLNSKTRKSPYHLAVIFSNRHDSKANAIGYEFDVPVLTRDDRGFRTARGKKLSELREEFDHETLRGLLPYNCKAAAFGGYMLFTSSFIFKYFLSVNVHPADLSVLNENGERKYIGYNAVKLTLAANEPVLRSTTHIMDEKEEHGPILMRSGGLYVNYPLPDDMALEEIAEIHQDTLKQIGDWVIFPKTLEYIASGRYAMDKQGKLYFDGRLIPNGVIIKE